MSFPATASSLHRRQRMSWGAALGVLGLLLVAVFAGAATAVIGPVAAMTIGGLVIGAAVFMLPLSWLISVLFLVSFVVTGQLIYFAHIEKALWFPFLIGAALLVRVPGELMVRRKSGSHRTGGSTILFQSALAIYFSTVVASSMINRVEPMQAVLTAKEYFFLWGVYWVVASGLLAWPQVKRVWLLLPWLMVLQLPLVLYQRFVVSPSRAASRMGAEWDAVVGAFGGNPEGGGASGAMGVFCVCAMALVAHAWYSGWMDKRRALLLLSAGFLSIALAEVKFAVVLIPVVFGVVFLRALQRKPFQGVALLALAAALSLAILAAYKTQYSTAQYTGRGETLVEYFDSMFSSSVDSDFANLRTREMGRVAAISFWRQQHGADNLTQTIIGHGMGATRVGSLVVGEAARGWPFNIARSSLAIALWEVGLLGTIALVVALVAAAWRAHRIASAPGQDATDRTLAATSAAVCVAVLAGLIYNTDFYYSHQTQLLLLLALGLQKRLWQGAKRPASLAGSTLTRSSK